MLILSNSCFRIFTFKRTIRPDIILIYTMTENNHKNDGIPVQPGGWSILSKEVLESLRPYSEEVSYPPKTAIVRRGDSGSAFYIIVTGQVEIILGEVGRRLPLAELGEGASFGEMSLLTQVAVSADVVTVSDVKLLVILAERF